MRNNLKLLLKDHSHAEKLEIIYFELIDFMEKKDWRGACHESCGIQYVLLTELGIQCTWRVGEVKHKTKMQYNSPVLFDHSWILIDEEIFDIAIYKSNFPELDSPPIIRNINISTLQAPDFEYGITSGIDFGADARKVQNTPLSIYFDNSPLTKKLGTWPLIQSIGRKVGLNNSIVEMRKKYNGIFWA